MKIKLLLIITISVFLFACKGKQLPKTDPELIQDIANKWSNALNTNTIDSLNNLYADSVWLYGKCMGKYDVLAEKENFIQNHTNFKHNITNILLQEQEDNVYKVLFDKTVMYDDKQLNVKAILTLQKHNDRWLITSETDEPTEQKLAKQALKKEEEEAKLNQIPTYMFEQKITLTGTLETITYTDVSANEYTTYIIKLPNPINVSTPNQNYDAQTNVTEVQIGFKDDQNPDKYLGKLITVVGEIYGEETIHDRRPVVMIHAIIQK